MTQRRIGVSICYCGGNISDFIEVERVRDAVESEPGVVVAKTYLFACSDAAQQEMIEDIGNHDLDGLVVASCSPKLHLATFQTMAERAGLNRYRYIQVNLREQCSWAHRDDVERTTDKAVRLTRAGIAKALLAEPLSRLRIETKPEVLIVGAGVAGLRTSLALSDLGLVAYVIEKSPRAGGWTGKWGKTFLRDRQGFEIIDDLLQELEQRENITLFTRAELVEKSGSVGDFSVKILLQEEETITLNVGAILVATGFDLYRPAEGEFGYGLDEVMLLSDFKELVTDANGAVKHNGRNIRDIVYIYCVGSRQNEGDSDEFRHCSRYCCSAAVHEALLVHEKDPGIHQFHLFRDMRTYGKHELLYEEACRKGSVFIRYADDDPPSVRKEAGSVSVKVNDQLLGGEELEINTDLVVLVPGMVPRRDEKLVSVLKLPVGRDGFYNEIHPKLRPVETAVNGVFIVGAAQGPRTIAESIASALSGVSKSAALLMKGYVDLEPYSAQVDPHRCHWCNLCVEACPYDAIEMTEMEGREVARVRASLCKGCGACVPDCPEGAIDVRGYTDSQMRAVIHACIGGKVS
jgi:heterodisulfide reductase subunit A